MPDLTQFRTQVDVFGNVPLELGSGHTILFDTKLKQTQYFDSHIITSGSFTNISYQRHMLGRMRLQAPMTILGSANYIRFINPTFENKEFYAYITNISYVNNSTVEIGYVIDPLQTWMFDYTLNPCFIEREHAETDNVGDNRVPEGLDTGEFVQAGLEEIQPWNTSTATTSFFVVATQDPQGNQDVSYDNNVYSALYCKYCATIQDLNTLLASYMNGITQSLEPIMSITQFPSYFLDLTDQNNPTTAGVTYTLTKDQTIGFGGFEMTDPTGYTIPVGTQTYRDVDFLIPELVTSEITYGKMFESGVVIVNDSQTWRAPVGTSYYSDPNLQNKIGELSEEKTINKYAPNIGSFILAQGTYIYGYVSLADCYRQPLYVDINVCTPGGKIQYMPKNNKLYTSPYNFMTIESPDGSNLNLKYEDFKNHDIHQFYTDMSVFPFGESICAPVNYETINEPYNIQKALFTKAYPICGLATDSFEAWWAQNRYSNPIGAAEYLGEQTGKAIEIWKEGTTEGTEEEPGYETSWSAAWNATKEFGKGLAVSAGKLIEPAIDALTGNVSGIVKSISSLLGSVEGHKAVPDTLVCKANANSIMTKLGIINYRVYYMKIRPEFAEMIDNYFSCYGYAVKRVKLPNIKSRTEWNYIKTVGCTISGNVPADISEAIRALYDSGLTFWHNPDHMYRYDLDNPINRG